MTRTQSTLCVLLVLALALVGISPARADDAPTVQVAVTSISPERIDPSTSSQQVTVEGAVTNISSQPLFWMDAQLWHYDGALTSFDLINAAIAADPNAPMGVRHVPGQPLVREKPLAPGARTTFKVTVPAASLSATEGDLVSLIGVHIQASTSAEGTRETVGRTRILLPHSSKPFEVLNLNVIAAPPGIRPGSNTVTPELENAVEGYLSEALTASFTEGVTTALDPAVYTAAQLMATRNTRPSEKALAFVERIDELLAEGRLWLLPPGNPNLARTPNKLRDKVAGWSAELAPDELKEAPSAVITPDVRLATKGFDHVITYGVHDHQVRYFHVASDASPVVIDDLPAPQAQGTLPPTGGAWERVDRELHVAETHAEVRNRLTSGPDGEQPTDVRLAFLAAYSLAFSTEDDALAYLDTVPEVRFNPNSLTLSASPSFVMGERTSEFPVTISNPTRVPVWVRVTFRSDNPQRITVPDTDVIRVGRGESQTLRVKPAAASNGITTVHAQLVTIDGTPISSTTDIEITSTEFGRVGWIIIIISGAVVLAGTVWRIRSVQRERSKESSESGQ
ncbi:DUF6049 family protein [uncultured Tessaracoccus sp.]|uniref:DUF6049 family protein n=1 Tax=uncultured Tessaracoccus sp. TaxID=905023 RepID=UPI00260DB3DA|nr:DUF6049 family protein [uncultured Tessaracoccus sp.]